MLLPTKDMMVLILLVQLMQLTFNSRVEFNEKNNAVFKLESLARMQGIDSTDAHSALSDSIMTAKVLNIVKNKQPETWESFFKNCK